jgi:hypothetical protein
MSFMIVPLAVQDDFWSVFITTWIIGFSNMYSFKQFFTDGIKPLSYYTCTDTDQIHSLTGYNRNYGILEVTTLVIHIIIQCKIIYYKQKGNSTQQSIVLSNSSFSTNSFSNFTTSILSITGLCVFTYFTVKVNSMPLSEIEVYPIYIYVQIYNLFIPNVVGFVLTVVYYVKHPEMARGLLQHIKDN